MDAVETLERAIKTECYVPGNTTQTGTQFCNWVLSNLYDLTEDEAYEAQCGGSDDAGIDAYFSRHGTFYLIQTKYSSHDVWGDVNRLIKDSQLVLARNLNDKEKVRLKELLENFDAFKAEAVEPTIRMAYVTGDEITPSIKDKITALHNGDLSVLGLSDLSSSLEDKIRNVSPRWKNKQVELDIRAHFRLDDTVVCAISAEEIARLAREANDYLFASNVRNFLKSTRINRKMAETLRTLPREFWDYNNGITLVCDDYAITSQKIAVTTPQVVNGCQTVTTIRNVVALEGAAKVQAATLLVRVIRATQETRRKNITRYTNAQNAVRGKDLYSLEDFQKSVKHDLKKFGYFFEIQRGSAAQMQTKERQSYHGTPALAHCEPVKWDFVIPAIVSVQAYAASVMMRPEIAYARSEDLTPLGKYYDELFPQDLDIDVRMFFLPFFVVNYARSRLHYGRSAQGWRKSAQFLFGTVFNMLIGRTSGAFTAQDLEAGSASVSAEKYYRVLSDKVKSIKLLELTDQVLTSFFEDGKVEEILEEQFGNEHKNMMKRKLIGSQWYPLLARKVERSLSKAGSLG